MQVDVQETLQVVIYSTQDVKATLGVALIYQPGVYLLTSVSGGDT